jgi:NAD(P)-dependent dehydrogenase (short-subunit alcohol dehydrogenase family)
MRASPSSRRWRKSRCRILRQQLETNFFGVVRVTQGVLPGMRERRRGRIINMSSVAGLTASPLFGPYSASKFAVEAISDALRIELHRFGIHVILIEPGYIPSGMEDAARNLSGAYAGRAGQSPYAAVYRGFQRSWQNITEGTTDKPEDCAGDFARPHRYTSPSALHGDANGKKS